MHFFGCIASEEIWLQVDLFGFLILSFLNRKTPSFTRFSDPGLKGGELSENLSQFPTVQVCVEMGSIILNIFFYKDSLLGSLALG